MKEIFKRKLANIMTFGFGRVVAGTAIKCCYFILYQPKVPENLKRFSENKK